jgi:hypothetical protein
MIHSFFPAPAEREHRLLRMAGTEVPGAKQDMAEKIRQIDSDKEENPKAKTKLPETKDLNAKTLEAYEKQFVQRAEEGSKRVQQRLDFKKADLDNMVASMRKEEGKQKREQASSENANALADDITTLAKNSTVVGMAGPDVKTKTPEKANVTTVAAAKQSSEVQVQQAQTEKEVKQVSTQRSVQEQAKNTQNPQKPVQGQV